MFKVAGLLLLNQIFENADIFVLRNFDSERSIGVIAENKAIERKKWRGIKSYDRFDLFRGIKSDSKEEIVATYLAPLL